MSLYDEYTSGNAEFPLPEDAKEFWDSDKELEAGQREMAKADCKEWQLLSLRANGGFEDKSGGKKIVVNIRAKGLDDAYPHTGEVAYWLEQRFVDNPKHPQRRTAAMLGKMMQALGLIPEDAAPETAVEALDQLVQAASKNTPPATFRAQLRWEKRAYTGTDGNTYHQRTHEFAFVDNVKPAGKEDLPF